MSEGLTYPANFTLQVDMIDNVTVTTHSRKRFCQLAAFVIPTRYFCGKSQWREKKLGRETISNSEFLASPACGHIWENFLGE